MDYLVNLTALSDDPALGARMQDAGITIRRPLAPEARFLTNWIATHFGEGWASEMTVSLARQPIAAFIAVRDGTLLGFSCHESIARGFFGPTGVLESARGIGIGHALLVASLLDLKTMGYAYAIIGDVGPSAFYEKTVKAVPIPVSGAHIHDALGLK